MDSLVLLFCTFFHEKKIVTEDFFLLFSMFYMLYTLSVLLFNFFFNSSSSMCSKKLIENSVTSLRYFFKLALFFSVGIMATRRLSLVYWLWYARIKPPCLFYFILTFSSFYLALLLLNRHLGILWGGFALVDFLDLTLLSQFLPFCCAIALTLLFEHS